MPLPQREHDSAATGTDDPIAIFFPPETARQSRRRPDGKHTPLSGQPFMAIAAMYMAGHEERSARLDKHFHRPPRAKRGPGKMRQAMRAHKRVMRYNSLEDRGGPLLQLQRHRKRIAPPDNPFLPKWMRLPGSRRIQPGDDDALVVMNRVDISRSNDRKPPVRRSEPLPEIEMRQIMIAWQHDKRQAETLEKIARRIEFFGSRPHCQIASDNDEPGSTLSQIVYQRSSQAVRHAAKMQI